MMIPKAKEDNWKIKIIGKSGLFKTRHEHAVEYVQTSVPIHALSSIEPVRNKFKKNELKFDLMLQRDLDDDRIKDEIIPYLNDNKLRFFPPILVVVLEVVTKQEKDKRPVRDIERYYPELVLDENFKEDEYTYVKRKYGSLFEIKILKVNDQLQRWYTELHVGQNATLLAIDGQHRLVALQAVAGILEESEIIRRYKKSAFQYKESFQDLEVPVTFIFIPDSYKGNDAEDILSIFRQVFVDVNKNARIVTRMRNILLEEHDIRSIFTRETCSFIREVLENGNTNDFITIDEVEWDKNSQENKLTYPIALTNLLIMREVFDIWFNDKPGEGKAFKAFLDLDRFKKKLDEEEYPFDSLTVDNYSFSQKKELTDVFKKEYLLGFANLFSSIPFALEWSKLVAELKENLHECIDKENKESSMCYLIKQYLFDGNEYQIHKSERGFISKLDEHLKEINKFHNVHYYSFIRTAMFQLGYFEVIFDLFGISEIESFAKFTTSLKKIVYSAGFKKMWKAVIIDNKKDLEKAIKGTGKFGKGKRHLVYELLKIIINNNRDIFKGLKVNFEDLQTNEEWLTDQFVMIYVPLIADFDEKVQKIELAKFKKTLKKFYLN